MTDIQDELPRTTSVGSVTAVFDAAASPAAAAPATSPAAPPASPAAPPASPAAPPAVYAAPAGDAADSAPAPTFGISSVLRELWLDVLALLWPCACLVCGVADRELCVTCAGALRDQAGQAAIFRTPTGLDVWAFGAYEGTLRTLIIRCKSEARPKIVRALGELLSGPLRAALQRGNTPTPLLIVTVPSTVAKVRERGFRHVDLLVRGALKRLCARGDPGAYLVTGALHPMPGRAGQVGLQAAQRERNAALVGVSWHKRVLLRGREVVLVDDIVTTGSTLLASKRALAAAGAQVVGVVALGVTTRKDLAASHA